MWNMCVPEGSIINTANSNISYKMKFTFNCKQTTVGSDASPAPSVPLTDPNAAATQFLVPGRYTVLDSGLWCEPAYMNATNNAFSGIYGSPVFICQFPMNSSNILNQSKV